MKLDKLKYVRCPVCGTRVVREGIPRFHVYGEGFEFQEFECGCVIDWVPNFHREEVRTRCPKHPDEVEKAKKREQAEIKVRRYISRLDVDDEFKEILTRYW